MIWSILVAIFIIGTNAATVPLEETQHRFDNYSVYSFFVENLEHLQQLRHVEQNDEEFSFWNNPTLNGITDIMTSSENLEKLLDKTQSVGMKSKLKIENVQSLIDDEQQSISRHRSKAFGWTNYYDLKTIYGWLDKQLETYPKILTNYLVGKSYEGRDIRAVLLSHNASNPLIIIEANIHAREWITSSTATWLLNELLTSKDPIVRDLAENINWLILPVFNVDGFEYTKRVNRLWRKTRQPHGFICYGADANRNFDFQWLSGGSSTNPCSETYAGPKAFSEPETRQLADFLLQFNNQTKIYISFHSYGQYFMFPYGHTYDHPENYDDLISIANKTVDAIATRYNSDYIYGSIADVMYFSSGSSVDWVYEYFNMKLGLVFEFRDHRDGKYGFMLPANQIIPNCLEILDGFIALVKQARTLGQL